MLLFSLVSIGSSRRSVTPVYSWSVQPTVVIGTLILCVLYGLAWRRGRASGSSHAPGYGRLALFATSMVLVIVALLSPVDSLADDDLLVMHMVQHVILLDLVPITLILSLNKVLLRPVTRRIHTLERRAGFLASPVFAVIAYVVGVYGWHVPAAYDLALHHSAIHALEHLTFSVVGTLYWWHVLSPIRSRRRLTGLGPLAYMITTKLFIGALGIVLTFLPHVIYAFYAHKPDYWGLTPTEDQSMAGLVMALEQSVVMGIAFVYLIYNFFDEAAAEQRRRERLEDLSAARS
ncbi:MAG TPA: cytochrome c oxidase assembly protein [Solirubrobacteraceae bacterium]|nr:cytochrome c oxidase assembly protein [Solirubrobacteraceae bacterium]